LGDFERHGRSWSVGSISSWNDGDLISRPDLERCVLKGDENDDACMGDDFVGDSILAATISVVVVVASEIFSFFVEGGDSEFC